MGSAWVEGPLWSPVWISVLVWSSLSSSAGRGCWKVCRCDSDNLPREAKAPHPNPQFRCKSPCNLLESPKFFRCWCNLILLPCAQRGNTLSEQFLGVQKHESFIIRRSSLQHGLTEKSKRILRAVSANQSAALGGLTRRQLEGWRRKGSLGRERTVYSSGDKIYYRTKKKNLQVKVESHSVYSLSAAMSFSLICLYKF